MLDFLDSAPQAEVLRKEARKPRMSLEHANVERKLGRGQVVSLAHESELHVVPLATLLTAKRDLLRCALRPTELRTSGPWLLTHVPSSGPKRGSKSRGNQPRTNPFELSKSATAYGIVPDLR
jgi:hypothetical protein